MKFNLRQKIFLHFFIFMMVNGGIWFFSYYSNSAINQKLTLIEEKNDLLRGVLEARRYEKNFFLRKNKNDLAQALSYIEKTGEKQSIIEANFAGVFEDMGAVKKRTQIINAYRQNMEKLYRLYNSGPVSDAMSEKVLQLRETITYLGRTLTTDIEQVEKNERKKVFRLVNGSRSSLIFSLVGLFFLTVLTAFFLVKNVNRPLKLIEDSIRRIVTGDFNKIPRIMTGDEFESLADSLNDMIHELERRKDQLVQAEKMSSLGTLTAGVAHELNNPLNNMSTSVQILREEIEDTDIEFKRTLLIEVEQQIDRSRDIIRALLEFSRQSGFSVEPVIFKNLVLSTMHLIAGEIPADIEVTIDVPDKMEANIDPRRIQQVLLNLAVNAVHAMTHGGRLRVCAFHDRDEKLFVFTVADTGQGIDKSDLSKIFDPFFTTKEVGKGSGLGLSIIHGIVEQHGGTIGVDSIEGKGSTFTITLPA